MNNDRKQLMPELRFPEFVDDGEWEDKLLGDVCFITNGKSNAQDHIENGIYPLFDRSAIIKASNEYIFDTEAVIIPGEGMRFIPKYFIGKFDLHQRAYALKDFTCIGNFVYYSMNHRSKLISEKAVQSTVLSLRLPILQNFPIQLPKAKDEQQKIASCLSSLDQLITAQKEKLELLKNHKKGLMQNLFPQEGETVPKFRFPEFENDGEWEKKRLNEIGVLVNGLTYSPQDIREKGLLVLRSSNVQNGQIELNDCVYVTPSVKGVNLTQKEDILICIRNGSKSLIGKNAIIKNEMPFTTHGAFMTIFRASNPSFVFQLFQSEAYQNQVDADLGATINSINGKNFLKYEFFIPKLNEQEKIASCLGSLDNLIWSQTEKIERLQLHKKGLMQGLFPKMID
ncbi:restriction endonuclease subunit S [Kaistella sp.]|uniref:restriction endonuclease subunit S n=1 Tax=Kaistella sp. TaxID=2782235 RepID=UPI00359F6174